MSTPENKSYLASITAFSPWGSRSATPKPGPGHEREGPSADRGPRGGDHSVSHKLRVSPKDYPRDCPPLDVQWFHAVDIPKRKPFQPPTNDSKPTPTPKKYAPFSAQDSRSIENAFLRLSQEEDEISRGRGSSSHNNRNRKIRVPVNEDFLFDVDVEQRELAPAYWQGPVYLVRRGTWFYSEGSTMRPCDENLAIQLEEGYLKHKPWRLAGSVPQRSASQPRAPSTSVKPIGDPNSGAVTSLSNPVSPRVSLENLRETVAESMRQVAQRDSPGTKPDSSPQPSLQTYRLFGAHMNSVVTYQDATTAWIVSDDLFSRMSSTVYQRLAGGAHLAGVKVVRGYTDSTKKKDAKEGQGAPTQTSSTKDAVESIASDKTTDKNSKEPGEGEEIVSPASETRRQTLARQMSSLVSSATPQDPEQQEEELRKRDEKEIQDDYRDESGEEQAREIEHLLLVTHGIGQRLGLRMESVNFVHDVNTLRKTLKSVYNSSPDLQALNQEIDKLPKNCRVQVLPICWRHLLDFPKQSLKHNRKEHDLADADLGEDDEYPNLDDITVEGVPAVRNLITDLALDILLYQSPAYKDHITHIVLQECNRIYRLFIDRNPYFKGKVSLIGHSLGSAIMFDILCRQKLTTGTNQRGNSHRRAPDQNYTLDFDVEDFYALGSPIGLFQMLKGRTIAARQWPDTSADASPLGSRHDPFLTSEPSKKYSHDPMDMSKFEITTSSPKCNQLFNIFHPTDPISYRIEPLISPAMKALKPQSLPYTKTGIFDAPAGLGLTGIGARVGQTVSGLWSSMYSGVASNLLNRSLGISAADVGILGNAPVASIPAPVQPSAPLSLGAGTNLTAGVGPSEPLPPPTNDEVVMNNLKRKLVDDAQNSQAGEKGEHPPTLIDAELETLYSGYEQRRKSVQNDATTRDLGDSVAWSDAEERGRKLKMEEAKVRALNSNGRVDYSIQEGAFEINLIASIASHLSYWGDEDVSHFMISQLLSRQRVLRKSRSIDRIGR